MMEDEHENMYTATLNYQASSVNVDLEIVEINAAVADISGFSVLYNRYYIKIFRFVLQRVANEELTADITSRVFLHAMLNLKKYRHKGYPFSSWLYVIARNEIGQEYRKMNKEREFQANYADFIELSKEIPAQENEERLKKLMAAVQKLKIKEMELIEMRFFEKRSFKEISEILEISENSTKVRMFRIIQKLKELMNV